MLIIKARLDFNYLRVLWIYSCSSHVY